jgi:hypothetical protein
MIVSQSCKSDRRVRWLSPGRSKARSDTRQSPQIVRQLIEPDAIRRSFISRFTAEHLVASARSKSAGSPAALKSP